MLGIFKDTTCETKQKQNQTGLCNYSNKSINEWILNEKQHILNDSMLLHGNYMAIAVFNKQ